MKRLSTYIVSIIINSLVIISYITDNQIFENIWFGIEIILSMIMFLVAVVLILATKYGNFFDREYLRNVSINKIPRKRLIIGSIHSFIWYMIFASLGLWGVVFMYLLTTTTSIMVIYSHYLFYNKLELYKNFLL